MRKFYLLKNAFHFAGCILVFIIVISSIYSFWREGFSAPAIPYLHPSMAEKNCILREKTDDEVLK